MRAPLSDGVAVAVRGSPQRSRGRSRRKRRRAARTAHRRAGAAATTPAPHTAKPLRDAASVPSVGRRRPPNAARLAPLPEQRNDEPEEIVVIGQGWRLPDLGSEWRARQKEAARGDRFVVTALPLYDPASRRCTPTRSRAASSGGTATSSSSGCASAAARATEPRCVTRARAPTARSASSSSPGGTANRHARSPYLRRIGRELRSTLDVRVVGSRRRGGSRARSARPCC